MADLGMVRGWGHSTLEFARFVVVSKAWDVVAKLVMPGNDPGGFIVTILIGIVGAVIGGFIGTQLGFGTVTGFNLPSIGIAILGALVLLLLLRLLRRS